MLPSSTTLQNVMLLSSVNYGMESLSLIMLLDNIETLNLAFL